MSAYLPFALIVAIVLGGGVLATWITVFKEGS